MSNPKEGINRRDSLKLMLGATGSSFLSSLQPVNDLAMPKGVGSESPQSPRSVTELSEGWRFFLSDDLEGAEAVAFDDRAWEQVTVPHTWQTFTNQSDYSHCWYRKHVSVPTNRRGERTYLGFDGAGIMAEVYLNGVKLGRHIGAYTRFVFEATDYIRPGRDNLLAIRCDSKTDIIGNLSRLPGEDRKLFYFCVATGLYRPVWLITTDACHISPMDYGSTGIYITESNLTRGGVDLSIKTVLRNTDVTVRDLSLRHSVLDSSGKLVGEINDRVTAGAGKSIIPVSKGRVDTVAYWSPATPRLYTVRTEVQEKGRIRDLVLTRTGFRTIAMKDGQVTVNGEPISLVGAALHEISEQNFHAVRDDEIRQSLGNFRDIGFNSAFLSHYPHSQLAYDLADEIGLLTWAEDGFVNGSYEPTISAQIVQEFVRQYYNHPCIFCWSAANEPFPANRPAASALLGVLRAEHDPRRLVTFNNEFKYAQFKDPQADFVTSSVFSGWYPDQGDVWTYKYPYINQTGGGGVISHQKDYRDRYHKIRWGLPPYMGEFEPEGYQLYLGEIFSTRAMEYKEYALIFWWAMKDFPGGNFRGVLNTKGLTTFGGYRKDVYYLFQSCLREDMSVLHICGKHWFMRGEEGNCIKVYSNSESVQLLVNGVDHGSQVNGNDYSIDGRSIKHVFYWENVLVAGRNEITATDGVHSEKCVIYFAPQGTMPQEAGSVVTDLQASNGPVWAINRGPESQWPIYGQFDGNANNTFDAVPKVLTPDAPDKITWIVTRRQSDPQWKTDLSFKIAQRAQGEVAVWLLAARTPEASAWVSKMGFSDSGAKGLWRNDFMALVEYALYTKEARAGDQVELHGSKANTDYVVFVTSH